MSAKAGLEGMRLAPSIDGSMFNKLKRKRVEGLEAGATPVILQSKKQRMVEAELPKAAQTGHARLLYQSRHEQPSATGRYAAFTAARTTSPPKVLAAKDLDTCPTTNSNLLSSISHGPMDVRPTTTAEEPLAAAVLHKNIDMQDAHATTTGVTSLTPLQQAIENQFNMQILMKHNELRLIEQELAKCQIALEQLRRCEIRPFPGDDRLSASVSAGTGASIMPPPGYSRPTHPAPYGVTDGPYTRHYQQWLLHDPVFDPILTHPQTQSLVDSAANSASRSTRNSGSVRRPAPKLISIPTRPVESLKSIPNYPTSTSKDKSAALVLRRSTDNQLVKLICNNCHRGNFSSIQGFLNHCRIAHKVDYKSHDAAAIDCGRPLDEQEVASLPLETQFAPPHRPSASRTSSAASTPFKNLVHPLITNPFAATSMPTSYRNDRVPAKAAIAPQARAPKIAQPSVPSPFRPSTQAPHLSSCFAKHNLGGNLEQAIANAKAKIDVEMDDEPESPGTADTTSPSTPIPGSRTVAGAARGRSLASSVAAPHPTSRKGTRDPTHQRPRPSPLGPMNTKALAFDPQTRGEVLESPQGPSPNLSPHTADSNPGLVSDHDDDDPDGSASEDEAPPQHEELAAPLGVGRRNCSDHVEIDVTVDEGLDEHSVLIRRSSVLVAEHTGLQAVSSGSRKHGMGGHGK